MKKTNFNLARDFSFEDEEMEREYRAKLVQERQVFSATLVCCEIVSVIGNIFVNFIVEDKDPDYKLVTDIKRYHMEDSGSVQTAYVNRSITLLVIQLLTRLMGPLFYCAIYHMNHRLDTVETSSEESN